MNTSSKQFGLMVAYVLPGFIVLAGIAPFSPTVSSWLQPLNQAQASLGAPLYAVMAATTIGMILGCLRWLTIDHIHWWAAGIKPPVWDDSRLAGRITAFDYLVEQHFRFAQFYGHTLIAVAGIYSLNRIAGTAPIFGPATDVAVLILIAGLFAGSRDALSKYYARTVLLIGQTGQSRSPTMTNGNQHDAVGTATSAKPRPEVKPQNQPPTPSSSKQNDRDDRRQPK